MPTPKPIAYGASLRPSETDRMTRAACVTLDLCMGNCTLRQVFVTSASLPWREHRGLDGGDAICQADADAPGVPGTYLALLSDF
jgi:hypothetical protein